MSVTLNPADISPQLNNFFDGLDRARSEQVDELTEQLRVHGNKVFNSDLPYGSIRHTPVLLDDENLESLFGETIRNCVEGGIRRSFIIAGNVGEVNVDEERREFNLRAIRRFGQVCTRLSLPFSYYETSYEPGTTISHIRADKHAAGLNYYRQQAKSHRASPRDILLLSNDADLRYMDLGYTPEMEKKWKDSLAQAWIGGPVTTHDRLEARFRRINKLLEWYDLGTEFSPGFFPTNYGINAGAYTATGGFGTTCSMNELDEIIEDSKALFGDQATERGMVTSTVRSSCRQLVSKIVDGEHVNYSDLCMPSDKASSYRRRPLPSEDISIERFQQLLPEEVRRLLTRAHAVLKEEIVSNAQSESLTRERIKVRITEIAALALEQAGRLDGTAEIVEAEVNRFSQDHAL